MHYPFGLKKNVYLESCFSINGFFFKKGFFFLQKGKKLIKKKFPWKGSDLISFPFFNPKRKRKNLKMFWKGNSGGEKKKDLIENSFDKKKGKKKISLTKNF